MKTQRLKLFFQMIAIILIIVPLEAGAAEQLLNIRHAEHQGSDRIIFDFTGPVYYKLTNQADAQTIVIKFHDCTSKKFRKGTVDRIKSNAVDAISVDKKSSNIVTVRVQARPGYQYKMDKQYRPWRLVLDVSRGQSAASGGKQKPIAVASAKKVNRKKSNSAQKAASKETVIPVAEADTLSQDDELAAAPVETITPPEDPISAAPAQTEKAISELPVPQTQKKEGVSLSFLLTVAFGINSVLFVGYYVYVIKFKSGREAKKESESMATTTAAKADPVPQIDFKSLIQQAMQSQPQATPPEEPVVAKISVVEPAPKKPITSAVKAYSQFQAAPAMVEREQIPAPGQNSIQQLATQVEKLLEYNYDIKSIARELNLGQDEVKMIINLRKKRDEAASPVQPSSAQGQFAFA